MTNTILTDNTSSKDKKEHNYDLLQYPYQKASEHSQIDIEKCMLAAIAHPLEQPNTAIVLVKWHNEDLLKHAY